MRLLDKSVARDIVIVMKDAADVGKTGLTLTITASKNGGSFSSISPTVTELTNGAYKIALTTSHTDTAGDLVLYITGTGAEPYFDYSQVCAPVNITTVANSAQAAVNAAALYSSFPTGTAQSGASGTITLSSGSSSSNDFYNDSVVVITSGTGAGQCRRISDYVGSSKVATVGTNWVTTPDNTSVYVILGRVE
jgi:hypothetical protein